MKKIFLTAILSVFPILVQATIMDQLIYTIRDPKTNSADFRDALEKIGEYLAFQVVDELATRRVEIETLTQARAAHELLAESPVLVTILRAGLPLNQGVHRVFPGAKVGFIAMSRNEETLKAEINYVALPDIKDQTVIITDTMLATGGSALDAIRIIEKGKPKNIFMIAAVASEPGVQRIYEYNPDIKIFAGVIDPLLNNRGYIVPGLGDAGDRSYGEKSSKQ